MQKPAGHRMPGIIADRHAFVRQGAPRSRFSVFRSRSDFFAHCMSSYINRGNAIQPGEKSRNCLSPKSVKRNFLRIFLKEPVFSRVPAVTPGCDQPSPKIGFTKDKQRNKSRTILPSCNHQIISNAKTKFLITTHDRDPVSSSGSRRADACYPSAPEMGTCGSA